MTLLRGLVVITIFFH